MATRNIRKKIEKNPPSPVLELSDDEIEILEEVPATRRPRKKTKVEIKPAVANVEKKPAVANVEKEPTVAKLDEDVLAGLDLEGVPEEEREQIKQALIASKQDEYGVGVGAATSVDRSVQDQQEVNVSREEDVAVHDPSVVAAPGGGDREESDEDCLTEKIHCILDAKSGYMKLSGATQMEVTEDDETQVPEDEDEVEMCDVFDASKSTLTEDDGLYDCSTQEDEPAESNSFSQQEAVATLETQDYQSESPAAEKLHMKDSKLSGATQIEVTEDDETQVPEDESGSSDGFEFAVNEKNTKSKVIDSEVSAGHVSGQAKSPERSSVKHEPITSTKTAFDDGKSDLTSGNQGTSKTEKSSKDSLQDSSLVRHFRKVKRKPTLKDCYFAPEGMDKEKCTTAIIQLFETYCQKLRKVQSRCKNLAEWSQPVKPGSHLSRTIDVKKRGQNSMYVFLSDDEDDNFEKKTISGRNQEVQCNYEELPEIGDENKTVGAREAASKNIQKGVGRTVSGLKCANSDKQPKSVDGDGHTTRQSRLKRRAKPQILVEDTQIDNEDWKEGARLSKGDYIVEETQQSDDDDWLSVKSRSGKNEFENPMQKAKMQGYTIPKRKATKVDKEHLQEIVVEQKDQETIPPKESTNNSKLKRQTKGQKRKAGQMKGATLVEDTQDFVDYLTEGGKRRNRTKRCFTIESDSESEMEIIPESQELLEESCDVTVIKKQPSPTSKPEKPASNFMAKMINTVKNILTPRKEENIQADVEEGSQSPVIKPRKLYRTPQEKFGDELKDIESEAYCNFKKNDKNVVDGTKQSKDTRSENKDKRQKECVRKLIERAPSGESNVSDDVSVTSSQISNTLLDDRGDLYSTQFASSKTRERRGVTGGQSVRETVKKTCNAVNTEKDMEDVLTIEDSDEEVLEVKKVQKVYGKPESSSKKAKALKNCDISQYFDMAGSKSVHRDDNKASKVKTKPAVISNVSNVINDNTEDISSTLQTDMDSVTMKEDACVLGENSDDENMPLNDSEGYVADAVGGAFNEKVKLVSIPDIHTELDVAQVKDDINGVGYIDPGVIPTANSRKTNTRRAATHKVRGIGAEPFGLLGGDSTAPVILKGTERFATSDTNDRPVLKTRRARRRKVSETVSSAEFEAGASRIAIGVADMDTHENMNVEMGGARKKTRRGMQKPEVASPVKKKEKMITCPLCDDEYPISVIEKHAGNCVGPDAPELMLQQLSHGDSEEEAEIELMMQQSQRHHSQTHHPNENVKEVVKNIKGSSPGEKGEISLCYICDVHIPKGALFEQHLALCIEEAKQQQMEVDKHGFARAFQPPADVEGVPTRTTRAAVRTKKDEGAVGGHPVAEVSSSGHKTVDKEDRYSSADVSSSGLSCGESDYSSSEDSNSSCSDNVTLATVARSSSSALITGPWNKDHADQSAVRQQSCDQTGLPDWMKYTSTSPIKSFVPISQQEDQDYFQKQFSYKKDTVEKRMQKRKMKNQGVKKKRNKRRKRTVRKSKKSV